MPTGYTRQSAADIVTGNTINAAPLNNEFNQVQAAMDATTGHNHDGTAGGGAPISLATAVTGTLGVANGGTGASTASNARTNLGLGTMATQSASAVAITGGTIAASQITGTDTLVVPGAQTIQLAGGGSLQGTYHINASGGGNHHKLIVDVGVQQYSGAVVSIRASHNYTGADLITNVRIVGDAPGDNRYLVCDTSAGCTITAFYEGISPGRSMTLTPGGSTVIGNTYPIACSSMGNVGVGTNSPSSRLDVNGDVTIADKIIHSGDTDTSIRFPSADTVDIETGGIRRFRVEPSGRVVIGRPSFTVHDLSIDGTSGDVLVSVGDTVGSNARFYAGVTIDGVDNRTVVTSRNNHPMAFYTNNLQSFRLGASGETYFPRIGTTASAANAFLDSSATPSNQLLRSTSSIRYKTGVADITLAEAQNVFSLRPIKYQSLADADDKDRVWYGLIAEEVSEVDQRLVHYMDGAPDGVQYERIIVPLLKIVKDLSQRVAALEAQNG